MCTELDPRRFPRSPRPEIAVSGRSNVGKSSLLNTLLGRKNFARVSKEPGKTRTVNFYLVDDRFYFVDLPGYGYAKVSAEMRGQWRRVIFDYIDGRDAIGGVVQLIDARHAPMKDDLVVLEKLIGSGRPFLVVMTKADKINRGQRSKVLTVFREHLGGVELELLGRPPRSRAAAGWSGESSKPDRTAAGGHDESTGPCHGSPPAGRTSPGPGERLPVVFFSARTGEGRDDIWRWIAGKIT